VTKLVFTCEHGGNKIPHEFKNLFESYHSLLKTHRAYDISILKVFKSFTQNFQSHNFHSEISRLLIVIIRNADIGLLYDPKSKFEKDFCRQWCKEILRYDRSLTVRFNYPYLGIADGFTSYLRAKLGKTDYCGVELEINQKLLTNSKEIKIISEILKESFPIKFENRKNDEKLNL
jgi:predicted N-formylglutamate amidohydrolase